MSSEPFFSIVIPTTRSRLLKYSVRSALAQSYTKFEVVVSDNDAQGVAEELSKFPDSRIRHVRTPHRLPINRSWEFAFDNSQGDWILLLADDDVILPSLLQEIKVSLDHHPDMDIVTWRHGGFVEMSYHVSAARGNLASPPYSGNIHVVNNRDTLQGLYTLGGTPENFASVKRSYPGIAYSAYSRRLVQRVKEKIGVLFNPTTPDYAAGVAALALSSSTLVIDKPLMIFHSTSDSNSAAASGDLATVRQVYAELVDEPFRNVPFKGFLTNRNVIVDTLLDMKKLLPLELDQFSVSWESYFKFVYFGLDQVRKQSGNTPIVQQEFHDFFDALSKQPASIKQSVMDYIESHAPPPTTNTSMPSALMAQSRKLIREVSIGLMLRTKSFLFPSFIRQLAWRKGFSTKGSYAGVENIFQFSQLLGQVISKPGQRQP
ncbi:MAG: glycosyltransferase family A protein [Rhodocyclaceae bacterium]